MDTKKTISAWLFLKDGENKNKVALQKRSLENKTFHFVCQATWAGKTKDGETVDEAVKRECKEELGEDFFNEFDFSLLKFVSEVDFEMKDSDWTSFNYVGLVSEKNLNKVKMHNEALPEFVFVGNSDEFFSLDSEVNPEKNIVLFDDQYKVLKQILNDFTRNNK